MNPIYLLFSYSWENLIKCLDCFVNEKQQESFLDPKCVFCCYSLQRAILRENDFDIPKFHHALSDLLMLFAHS